jgi:hypothetical protein
MKRDFQAHMRGHVWTTLSMSLPLTPWDLLCLRHTPHQILICLSFAGLVLGTTWWWAAVSDSTCLHSVCKLQPAVCSEVLSTLSWRTLPVFLFLPQPGKDPSGILSISGSKSPPHIIFQNYLTFSASHPISELVNFLRLTFYITTSELSPSHILYHN